MAESAFVVFVPEAEALVGDLRARHDPAARQRVAAHITVLFPFMAPSIVGAPVLRQCAEIIASQASFSFSLSSVGRFATTAYLEPVPPQPFVELTQALWGAFPAFPPFRGEFSAVVPHLTVAHGDANAAESVAHELEVRLGSIAPLCAECTSVALIENSSGYWRQMHVFRLAADQARKPA